MKTEEFDDAIKKKADNLYFNPREEDINRIHRHVSANMHAPSLFRTYGWYATAACSLLVIGGLITWNIMQSRENKTLSMKVDSLNKELVARANSTERNSASTNATANNETQQSNSITNSEQQNTNSKNGSTLHFNSSEINNSPVAKTAPANEINTQKNNATHGNSNIANRAQNNAIHNEKTNNIANKDNAGNEGNADNNGVNKSANNKSSNSNNNSIANSDKNKTSIKDNPAETKNESENKQPEEKIDSATTQKSIADEHTTSEPKLYNAPAKKSHKSFSLASINLHFMAGLGAETAKRQFGTGIYGELGIGDRWSFSAGVKALMVNNEMYPDENDFNQRKNAAFRNIYGPADSGMLIRDIHTHSQIIQIPIALNYTLPLTNSFGLYFSAGTDIDIYARQKIDYPHPQTLVLPAFPFPAEHREVNAPVLAFNNAVLAVGVQKKWGHFVARFSPYICPQFSNVLYKKDDLYAGARLNLFYSFGG